jgi:8-oxo-dGTP diphosphatase
VPDDVFKNRIRLRVNGLLKTGEALLMVQLKSPVTGKLIWMPPGGGLEFGESMKAGLQREFFEETGLKIEPGALAFVNELVQTPFHAVECYFWGQKAGGSLQLGTDPELAENDQLLQDLQWIPIDRLNEYPVVPEILPGFIRNSSSQKPSLPFDTKS